MNAGSRYLSAGSARGWQALFGTPWSAAITLALAALAMLWLLPSLMRWGVAQAVWTGDASTCRVAAGACWAFVHEKFWYFMHGSFPDEWRWRANAAALALCAAAVAAGGPFRARRKVAGWFAGVAVAGLSIHGGGWLPPVRLEQVGGLLLTLLLAVGTLPLALLIGIGLALGRHDGDAVLRAGCTAVIEFFRCSPFVALLVVAYVALPLLMPARFEPPKLTWACIVFLLAAAAYMAEAVRGGLQAISANQALAAKSLGMGYVATVRCVLLPQAFKNAVPALANAVITFFKNTSLVTVISLTDFLGAVKSGAHDAAWAGYEVEGYVFAALVYFVACCAIGFAAHRLERRPW